jgi:hypothetical protein
VDRCGCLAAILNSTKPLVRQQFVTMAPRFKDAIFRVCMLPANGAGRPPHSANFVPSTQNSRSRIPLQSEKPAGLMVRFYGPVAIPWQPAINFRCPRADSHDLQPRKETAHAHPPPRHASNGLRGAALSYRFGCTRHLDVLQRTPELNTRSRTSSRFVPVAMATRPRLPRRGEGHLESTNVKGHQ